MFLFTVYMLYNKFIETYCSPRAEWMTGMYTSATQKLKDMSTRERVATIVNKTHYI